MFRYIISILNQKEKNELIKISVMTLISPIFDLFSFSVILFIMNTAIRQNGATPELVLFSAGMGITCLLKGFFELYKCYLQNRFINFGAQRISIHLFELFQKEDLIDHNKKNPIQALTIIRDDTFNCLSIPIGFLSLCIQTFTLLIFCGALIWFSGIIGLWICLGLLLFMIVIYLQNRLLMMHFGEQRRLYAIKSNAQVTTAFGMFKETKISSQSETLLKRYNESSKNYADIQSRYTYKTRIISVMIQNSIMTVLFFALAIVLQVEVHLSELLIPFVICMTLILRMLPISVEIVTQLTGLDFSRKSYETVREALERYDNIKYREKQKENKRKKQLTLLRGIEIRNLTFGYQKDIKIFEDASVKIPARKTIAIIGPSGSGKTTFLDLLLGLLKPETGSIIYDDYDIVSERDKEGESIASIGDVVSYIPQTVYLNGETIRNNVAFYETEASIDEEQVCKCLQQAQIWKEVTQMPLGINTLIGENGLAISGGQRQRIALARALYKNFEILIMDEATAALDMETEKAVLDSIREIKGNKTLLMVTHHMSLANECELLYKIENRKIIRIR